MLHHPKIKNLHCLSKLFIILPTINFVARSCRHLKREYYSWLLVLLFFQFNLSENNRNVCKHWKIYNIKMIHYETFTCCIWYYIFSEREPAWHKDSVLLCLHPHSSFFLPSIFMHILLGLYGNLTYTLWCRICIG